MVGGVSGFHPLERMQAIVRLIMTYRMLYLMVRGVGGDKMHLLCKQRHEAFFHWASGLELIAPVY